MKSDGKLHPNSSVSSLPGVGRKTAASLGKLEIYTCKDLIFHFPAGYIRYFSPRSLSEARADTAGAFFCVVESVNTRPGRGGQIVLCVCVRDRQEPDAQTYYLSCANNACKSDGRFNTPPLPTRAYLNFYGMSFLKNKIKPAQVLLIYGIPIYVNPKSPNTGGYMRFEQPSLFEPEEYKTLCESLQPKYPSVKGLGNKRLKNLMKSALDLVKFEENQPQAILARYDLCGISDALRGMRFPANASKQQSARKRLVFD